MKNKTITPNPQPRRPEDLSTGTRITLQIMYGIIVVSMALTSVMMVVRVINSMQ